LCRGKWHIGRAPERCLDCSQWPVGILFPRLTSPSRSAS
jgi:hypothetical protein